MTSFYPTSEYFSSSCKGGRVTIITRTKNRPVLLARAFASILCQTYQNWDLMLVNDGGDPAPVEDLVSQYKAAFKDRLTLTHHRDSVGMEAASNSALKGATGDYIIVHDDDDAWHPAYLTETVTFLESSSNARFAAVATNCEVVYEEINGDIVHELERISWGYWKERVDLMDQLRTNNFPPICLLIRKCVVDKIGSFNADLPVLGDWDYNLRLLLVGDIGTINKPLAYYHHRRANTGAGTYGNSVTDGINKHLDYQVLYRNSMLRLLLTKEPGMAGVLHVLLTRIEQLEQRILSNHQLQDQALKDELITLIRIQDEKIDSLVGAFNKIFRPLRWGWRKLLPIRSLIMKYR